MNHFKKLVELYTKQIENTGHGPNCLWKNFETPIEEVYHLRQYLPNTNSRILQEFKEFN